MIALQGIGLLGLLFLLSCQTPKSHVVPRKLEASFFHSEDMTGARAFSQCKTYQEDLLVFGGVVDAADSPYNSDLFRFETRTKKWLKMPSLGGPSASRFSSVAVWKDTFYVFGGDLAMAQETNDSNAFDLLSQTWREKLDSLSLSPRKLATMVPLSGGLLLYGGQGQSRSIKAGILRSETGRWEPLDTHATPEARSSHILLPLDDERVFVWGGFTEGRRRNDGFIWNTSTGEAEQLAPSPILGPLANARALFLQGRILIWGGVQEPGQRNGGAWYHPETRQWEALIPIPEARYEDLRGSEIVAWGKEGFLVFGGRFGQGDFAKDLWFYSLAERQWQRILLDEGPEGRIGHCFVVLGDGKFGIFGGIGHNSEERRWTHFSGLWILEN
jgi:hypothetical protein